MAEILFFPRSMHAVARPPRLVRVLVLLAAAIGAAAAVLSLGLNAAELRIGALLVPAAALGLCIWVAWYARRCRFEVWPRQIQFFGFLPSQPVPLDQLEEIVVVQRPANHGRFDRSHVRLRRRGSTAAFKLSLGWEGADDVVQALERLVPGQLQHEEAS